MRATGVPRRLRPMLLVVAALLVAGCTGGGSARHVGSTTRPVVRVASFDFSESRLLAEIYAAAIEGHGYPVQRVLGLGSREIVQPALQQGLVDLVPEYAGSALRFLDTTRPPADAATATVHARLAEALGGARVVVLSFAPAQDTNGIVVTAATALSNHLSTISDLRPVASQLAFGAPPECPERPFCLLGLRGRYGLHFAKFLPMPSREVTLQALATGEIAVGLLETTDPHLADGKLVLLTDDRKLQPAENIVPVVRRTVIDRYGQPFARLVDAVSARLTTASLRSLNRRVTIDAQSVAAVAHDWLVAHGLAGSAAS